MEFTEKHFKSLKSLLSELKKAPIKKSIIESKIFKDELTIIILPQTIIEVMKYLHNTLLFKKLISICGADFPSQNPRFEVIYHLLSIEYNIRLRLKVAVNEDTHIPSICSIFSCANWYEREVWDLYGIKFSYHPDLRRIMTDYGFEGHPLRKDFPLTGHVEVRYNALAKTVEYEKVELMQEFRNFDFLSPWSGESKYVLPGDEKAN